MPTTPAWSESLRVGNPTIDKQHRQLIALCNRAAACVSTNTAEGRSEFHLILNELSDLINSHFSHEEALLERNHSPNLAAHKAEHLRYQEKIADLLFEGAEGRLDKATLHSVAQDYLIKHMLEMDLADKPYLVP